MKTIKINNYSEVPKNFTGIVEYSDRTKIWFKEGRVHRLDGPALERINGIKEWLIEGKRIPTEINITNKLFLGKEKGKYGLEWLRFLVEEGIEEYPIVPGIEYKITKNYSLGSFLESHKQ